MATSITIRDVPEATRDQLAARAARSGRSLQEFLRLELIELAERPDPSDVIARARERLWRTGTSIPAETTNALRKAALARTASQEEAAIVLGELQDLRVAYYPFAPFMERVWELRAHVTSYDAWYVVLAESLDVPLATIDRRLANATGPRCRFHLPALG